MARQLRYYDYDRGMSLKCHSCAWEGSANSGSTGYYRQLLDVSCPKCGAMLLIVSYPTDAETEAAAGRGNPEAIREFEKLKESRARWARKLVDPDDLPEVSGEAIDVVWDFEESEGERWTVLWVGDREIWREPAFWEGHERFREVAKLLGERYGSRLRTMDSTRASWLYLYGDRLSDLDVADEINAQLEKSHTTTTKENP